VAVKIEHLAASDGRAGKPESGSGPDEAGQAETPAAETEHTAPAKDSR